ncbi:FCD domain-containing protein [Paracoccus aestuariivivens]|uniref:FCD domain-containing protein n=1 Tax=Paracoccus aestuariivivens TaxID=1820333 RepID=A0A6L6JDX6_9RHOB|nr:FCD domain-containing protein [Paracoccus aestuariivivens]
MTDPNAMPNQAAEANSHRSGASQLYSDLRRRIIGLEFPPGTILLRPELAAEYGVSQTPLRDAMQRLDQDGLVHVHPQSKTVVSRINMAQIYEAHFMRTALEIEVVVQLARHRSEETIANARAIVRMQEAIAGMPDQLAQFQQLDENFHRTLFVGVGHGGLHEVLQHRSGHLGRMRKMQPHDSYKISFILSGHHEILDSISSGDESKARIAMRAHLSRTVIHAPELRERYPDYFC